MSKSRPIGPVHWTICPVPYRSVVPGLRPPAAARVPAVPAHGWDAAAVPAADHAADHADLAARAAASRRSTAAGGTNRTTAMVCVGNENRRNIERLGGFHSVQTLREELSELPGIDVGRSQDRLIRVLTGAGIVVMLGPCRGLAERRRNGEQPKKNAGSRTCEQAG